MNLTTLDSGEEMLRSVRRALVIEPHADDLVIGCGGVVQHLLDRGAEVFTILLSPSPPKYRKIQENQGEYLEYSWDKRFAELKGAMDVLGLTDISIPFLDRAEEVHHRLDTMPQSDLIEVLEKKIKECRPDVIFVPEMSYNQDHRATYDACMTASRPHMYSGSILAYETTMEKEFDPNFVVGLTSGMAKKKLDACSRYQTQLGCEEHLFSLDTMMTTMKMRGRLIFAKYAEAFRLVRGVS